jgi:hypothetical protein
MNASSFRHAQSKGSTAAASRYHTKPTAYETLHHLRGLRLVELSVVDPVEPSKLDCLGAGLVRDHITSEDHVGFGGLHAQNVSLCC